MRLLLRPLVALALAVALPAAAPVSADDVCDVRDAPRVVAIGDIHGAYDNFVKVLQMTGLVDDEVRWAGGKTHLVQTGDLLDRGVQTREILDLMMRLEKEAKKAGGRVHALLGNHEAMNMLGDLRYVDPEEYEAFRTPRSENLREDFFNRLVDLNRDRARSAGEEFDEDAFRARLEEQAPLGFVERTQMLSDKGEYGRWLRKRPAMARVNGVAFLHGGLSPEVALLGCKEINKTVRREITRDFRKTRQDPQASLVAGENGPLWYRGLAKEDEATFAPALEQILEAVEARAIVVGHTVTVTGRIQSRFGGRVIMIDAGMAPAYKGSRAALEIGADGEMAAVYPDGRESIERLPLEVLPADEAVAAR
jgi:hypothetical protein